MCLISFLSMNKSKSKDFDSLINFCKSSDSLKMKYVFIWGHKIIYPLLFLKHPTFSVLRKNKKIHQFEGFNIINSRSFLFNSYKTWFDLSRFRAWLDTCLLLTTVFYPFTSLLFVALYCCLIDTLPYLFPSSYLFDTFLT